MTTDEIVRALRCCQSGEPCTRCPAVRNKNCVGETHKCAADLIERMTAENVALREKAPQWVSVQDVSKLPQDHLKRYLVAFKDAGGAIVDMARHIPGDGWRCDNWDVPQGLVTHWMPLPEAPEEGEKA